MNVLFLCTGNSCRSILGEAIFNHLAPAGWRAMSAGSQPTGQVHTRSLALLAREGIPTGGLHSKSVVQSRPTSWDIVTVCASAAGSRRSPCLSGARGCARTGAWTTRHTRGSDAEINAAFMTAYRILRTRIEAFLALPLDELKNDRTAIEGRTRSHRHALAVTVISICFRERECQPSRCSNRSRARSVK